VRGEGDILGARLMPMRDEHDRLVFTSAIYETRPMVVQRNDSPGGVDLPATADSLIGPAARGVDPVEVEVEAVLQTGDLGGESVHLPQFSPYVDRMIEVSDSLGDEIQVVVVTESSYERLIRGVAMGEVDYVVAPEALARLREGYFGNISITPAIGPTHPVAMAVRANSPDLHRRLEEWLSANADLRDRLYQKYFVDRRGYHARVESEYLTSETGVLSEYDDLFRRHVQQLGWDWRLLASLSYQESEFLPTARSWAGAQGLMQLMPNTARQLGVRNVWDPEENVSGGARFLVDLTTRWTPLIHDEGERLKFILASYNVGPGHVDDARRLTDEYGGNSQVWNDVAYWLLQKSKREVYTLPVVRHGYARGLEPVTYVSRILDRFDHYRQFVTEPTTAAASPPP
jgi:membrane-bound lytic murein transglycosylase F